MFEVGKKYIYNGVVKNIVKVLALTKKSALVTYERIQPSAHSFVKIGDELLWKRCDTEQHWAEYKEPVVIKETRFVCCDKDSLGLWVTTSAPYGTEILGEIEISVTNNILTDASIVKGK